jgi:hypothetical protein
MRCLLPAVLALAFSPRLLAGLEMEIDPVELRPKPEDEVVETTFAFTNKGARAVRITGLESSCSCLEATLDKAVYQPGEKGKGQAKFKTSSFVGRHEKTLHIYTDNPAEPDKIVNFIIDIPAVVNVEPNLIEWVIGEKPEPREFVVTITGADPVKITEVSSTRQSVAAAVREIKPGREYRVTVTPTTTAEVLIGAVIMGTDSKIPKYQRQMAFFNVVRPELSEKRRAAAAAKEK